MADFEAPRSAVTLPPPTVRPLGVAQAWRDFRVDYAAHPAYRSLEQFRPRATLRFLAGTATLLAKRLINYESIPYDIRKGSKLGFARAALANLVRGGSFASIISRAYGGPMADAGVAVIPLRPGDLADLTAASAASFDALAARRAAPVVGEREFDESRSTASRASAAALFDTIERLFASSGVMEIANAYLGRTARLVDVNPQINDATDSFWKNIFPDVGLTALPRTAYCHRDASGGDLKAIIYMTDVGPQNGPFAYAVGSNRVKMSRLDDFICEANDMNGFAATTPGARAAFAGLPRLFQQKGSFGNDLTDDNPASAMIADALWSIEGPAGSIVLFDTKGIHRGGMVTEGERRVITCVIG